MKGENVNKKISEDGNRILFETDNEDEYLLQFTDDVVDAAGHVKGNVKNKGAVCCRVATHLYKVLASYHLPVRLKSQKSENELVVKKAALFPFYVNLSYEKSDDGTEAPKIEFDLIEEGKTETVEMKALSSSGAATEAQVVEVRRFVLKMNVILKDFFRRRNLQLLGFRTQFGVLPSGKVALCSELTMDSCDIKDVNSRRKFTTTYVLSHLDSAAELYDEALNAILY
ncbi:hypothetical protein DRI50_07690 [candidate division KSB1 bacterium]|nr:MAG: hypothetical protein DRI50_07690 [candidate division KSB1 bacterium]